MSWCTRFTAATALFLGLAGPVMSQSEPAPGTGSTQRIQLTRRSPEELARIDAAAHLIHLNVLVLDATGKPVTGLGKADFRVLAHGEPQTITAFQDSSRPVRILLVLDAINNTAGGYAEERKAIRKFLSQNGSTQPFPVSLVRVALDGLTVEAPQRDTAFLQTVLESLPGLHRKTKRTCDAK